MNKKIQKNSNLQKFHNSVLVEPALEDINDRNQLVKIALTNLIGQIPIYSYFTEVSKDYLGYKVAKRREKEINSLITIVNQRLTQVEIKQEALDYFENSLIFHIEQIWIKLVSNPDKGFDEIFAAFIYNALTNLEVPIEEKDIVLSTLISLDKLDLLILQEISIIFNNNLNKGTKNGVKVNQIEDSLLPKGITKIGISRAIQRLESQDLIQPITNNTTQVHNSMTVDQLQRGIKSESFYSSSGFIVSEFGRTFIQISDLNSF